MKIKSDYQVYLMCVQVVITAGIVHANMPDPGAQLSGWELVWHDEFDGDTVDINKWELITRKNNHNNEKQYYLPEQAAIDKGMLVITTTNEPYDGRAYRSARLFSWHTQAHGRFEIRAKIPTTKGIWPAIWLLPRGVKWPTGGEIDIMEHKGSKTHMVSSAYHYANDQGRHAFHNHRYWPDPPVAYPEGFHLYAVEWDPGQIRYFVDGVEHLVVSGGYVSDTPMGVVLNTAVGGWFDGEPDVTTEFPQKFYIDYVRIWKRNGPAPEAPLLDLPDTGLLVNGGFEDRTRGWVFSGNAVHTPYRDDQRPDSVDITGLGRYAVKLYNDGQISQDGIRIEAGRSYKLSVRTFVLSRDTIVGTQNSLCMKVLFFTTTGKPITGTELTRTIADGSSSEDLCLQQEVEFKPPISAATAQVTFQFQRPADERGAVWIDQATLIEAR